MSRRRAKRRLHRRLAWRLAEWQTCALVGCALGWPGDSLKLRRDMGPWCCSAEQQLAFENLVEANMNFCRLGTSRDRPEAKRGIQTLQGLIHELEDAFRRAEGDTSVLLPAAAVSAAKPVEVDRIAVHDPAGEVGPNVG